MAQRLGPPLFDPKIPPKKFFCGSLFLRSFPGNEAHKLLFWGSKMGRFGLAGQEVYVERVSVHVRPLIVLEIQKGA